MRVVQVGVQAVSPARFAPHRSLAPGALGTSVVALVPDVVRGGRPPVGHGFGSGDRPLAAFERPAIADVDRLDPLTLRPHGGHLFPLHVAAALGLLVDAGGTTLPAAAPGIGLERSPAPVDVFGPLR